MNIPTPCFMSLLIIVATISMIISQIFNESKFIHTVTSMAALLCLGSVIITIYLIQNIPSTKVTVDTTPTVVYFKLDDTRTDVSVILGEKKDEEVVTK